MLVVALFWPRALRHMKNLSAANQGLFPKSISEFLDEVVERKWWWFTSSADIKVRCTPRVEGNLWWKKHQAQQEGHNENVFVWGLFRWFMAMPRINLVDDDSFLANFGLHYFNIFFFGCGPQLLYRPSAVDFFVVGPTRVRCRSSICRRVLPQNIAAALCYSRYTLIVTRYSLLVTFGR
jgi:hypothetical protein